MDGTTADMVLDGRLVRPTPYDYAVSTFPNMILKLMQNKLQVDTANSPDRKRVYTLYSNQDRYFVLKEDYDICIDIAESISMPLFSTDMESDYLARIKALVQVKFYGRQ